MIKQDNWIRAQCETPTHIYRKILGSVEYASAPFTQEQKYSMELQEFLVNLNSPLNAVPVPNLDIPQDAVPAPTKSILGVGSITPITEEELRVWKPMIHPFSGGNIRYNEEGGRIVSKGLSSFGYDVTLANKFKVFTNVNGGIIDPLAMPENCYVEFEGEHCIIPPNSYLLGHTVEYFHIPDDVIVVCVGKSTLARCFAGDTKVQLADGTTPTFIELIKRAENGERLFGYSVDDRMQIAISELFSPRKIGTEEVLEVVLDNDEIIECTPDHKFLTKEGLEIKAEDLAPGDSLFPLYKIRSRGYEAIVQPNDWTLTPGHKLAAKVTCDQFYAAMCEFGTATKAARALEISKSYVTRHFQDAVRKFYNNPSLASNHKVVEIRRKGSIKDVYCLTAPEHGNFALAAGVFVNNCGAIVNVTPIEPGFSGQVVIEISNSTNLPIKVYANQGVAQFLFLQGSERCSVSYADKNGKYQGQTGITTARV